MRNRAFVVLSGAITALAAQFIACHARTLLVGGGDDGGAADGGTLGDGGTGEVWSGYFQGYKLASGSDRVRLTFSRRDALVTGTAFLGDSPADPPPTDPNVGYPPRLDDASSASFRDLAGPPTDWEKFELTIRDGTSDGVRITFDVFEYEVYKSWCAIQTQIYPIYGKMEDGSVALVNHGCVPNAGFGWTPNGCTWDDDAGEHPVDCLKFQICSYVCACNETSCSVVGDGLIGPKAQFDLRRDGNTLVGTASFGPGSNPPVNVVLTRQ